MASRYASMTRGNPINAASIARWLVTGSGNPSGFEGFANFRRDRARSGRHLCTPGDAREQTLVRIQGPDLRDVSVVDWRSRALQDGLQRSVRGDEPEPRDPGVRRDIPHGRIADSGLLARLDGHRTGVRGIPPRLGEPQAVRVSRTQIERVRPRGPVGLEARRQRRTLVRDEQVPRGKARRQVREGAVLMSPRSRDEETHRIPDAVLDFDRRGGEEFLRLLEGEFLSLHAGTSQTVPWASNRWPVTRIGSWPSSHAQKGSVTSGSGRSLMS